MKKIACATTLVAYIAIASLLSTKQQSQVAVPMDSALPVATLGSDPPTKVGFPTFASPHASPIAIRGDRVFVANTPADTLDVIDAKNQEVVARVRVGIDPVSVAIRPDGKEIWVANHVSDSVSVISNEVDSPNYLQVIATIQDFDEKTKATRFDEPVGVAFASNDKAYIALSSENQIAVVNVPSRAIKKRLTITAQDPRAIVVRGNRLYVIPFESNNKTQLSGGVGKIDGELVTFNAHEHSIANNNVLSLGHVVDIVKHPKVPDRDLYVFDTQTDELIEVIDSLGTLLYGMAVDSKGKVYVAQTDARNGVNGRAGSKGHGLKELGNRAFLNQITTVDFDGTKSTAPEFIDLEPLPPIDPEPSMALATPFAIEVSGDDSTLVVSAAGSDKLFTVDAQSGKVLGRVGVGAVPRGIALQNRDGRPFKAWVLNAVSNTVSFVDVADLSKPSVINTIELQDPTHPTVKRGRIAFNTASASANGTFSCASCHPDGHTDQLLWVLKTPVVTGGDQIMPRSTMPIRGLRDTAPYHWDGVPGDPYGGNNSANIHGSDPPNSKIDDPTSTARHLIDGGLAATMARVGDNTVNDEGKSGQLSAQQRDDMAVFLLSIPYPPAQRRAYTNVVSQKAQQGFKLFHIDGDLDGKPKPNVCGNCHRMPFLVSTNTPGTGMDAPTWRGAYDRFLILPQGRLNIIDFDFYERVAQRGIPERNVWQFSWAGRRRFDPVWNMVLEGSTGFSGAFGRQVMLSQSTANEQETNDLFDALELSAVENAVVLEGDGVLIDGDKSQPIMLQFDSNKSHPEYIRVDDNDPTRSFTRAQLVSLASNGDFIGTFTGRHGAKADFDHPQPAIWTLGPIQEQRGRQRFPFVYEGKLTMTISGRHIGDGAHVVVDGRRVPGSVDHKGNEKISIQLESLPSIGMHLLQLQNPEGMFSNDFIFHVAKDADAARQWRQRNNRAHVDIRQALSNAIADGDLNESKRLLGRQARRVNERAPESGSTPLSDAALHGQVEIAKYLLKHGANVNATNRDGSAPLHVAAFLCNTDVVNLLLEHDASIKKKSRRGETPIDVVSSPWSDGLADFYTTIGRSIDRKIDLERIESERPKIARLLREHGKNAEANVE